ncbi:MAG TPA: hypothetical protein PKD27_14825, partial [Tepidiformaceae bacterium]|nr:hypothetical protein [Tepidiformaceae bacterium]
DVLVVLADRGLTFAGWVREQLGALAEERARRKRIDAFERLMRLAQEGAQPWPDDDDDPATRAVREAIDAGAEDMMRVE